MTTWTESLADKHTYSLSKSLSVNEVYTLSVSGEPADIDGEVYLGTDIFIGHLNGNKLTFTLEQASDAKFITFYILSSDANIDAIKLEDGDGTTDYIKSSMAYQINENMLSFDGHNVKYILDGRVVRKKGINLIRNSNFANGITGWNPLDADGFVSNFTYTLVSSGTSNRPCVRYTTDSVAGDIVYVKFNARINNPFATSISFDMHGTNSGIVTEIKKIDLPDENNWYEINGVVNTSGLSGNLILEIYHSYVDSNTAKYKEMEIKNVQLINLTQSYGLGNEPSLEYIHSHPEEFTWTPSPNDLVQTVEIKNNLVGDLENRQVSRLRINSLKIYSRNLTDAEMIQNYRIEKERYGV